MITVILVGIGEWDRYTKPAIESIRKHEPGVSVVVVDNGCQYPDSYQGVSKFVKVVPIASYAQAINYGVNATPDSDYWIILNNDILCNDKFIEQVWRLPNNAIGANTINMRGNYGWIDGWHYCIPRPVWEQIGPFDEAFKVAAFEDADYTIRAQKRGIDIIQTNHPFTHLWTHGRYKVDKFWHEREQNKRYLMGKHPEYRMIFDGYN